MYKNYYRVLDFCLNGMCEQLDSCGRLSSFDRLATHHVSNQIDQINEFIFNNVNK